MKYKIIFIFFFIAISFAVNAQQLAYVDAAQAYNRILIEKSGDSYMRIKNYKVVGSPYLFGQKNKGDLFAIGETAYNIELSYNTYNNEVEFYSTSNPKQPLNKEVEKVDSFIIDKNPGIGINEQLKFINSKLLYQDGKDFYLVLLRGSDFDLYKKYTSALGIVSTNYIQSELRQFDIGYEYFYLDKKTKQLKKLKLSNAWLKKEFSTVADVSSLLQGDQLQRNPENVLSDIIKLINGNK